MGEKESVERGDDMYLAQNLKYLREKRGMNQKDLSVSLGLSQAAVGNWESGSRTPDIETIIKLAQFFDVTLDDFILRELRAPVPKYAENMIFLRKKHGMKQMDIAKLLDVSNATYCKYEIGMINIGIDKISKLADFFGVTMDQLIKQDLSMEDGNGKTK